MLETSTTQNQTFLTEDEKITLSSIQNDTQSILSELGEISLIKIQIELRYESAKSFLLKLNSEEQKFTESLSKKYGNFSLDPETAEIIKAD